MMACFGGIRNGYQKDFQKRNPACAGRTEGHQEPSFCICIAKLYISVLRGEAIFEACNSGYKSLIGD
jgi:hypothetical protein